MDDYLFCCLTAQQKDILDRSGDRLDAKTIYQFQKNLVMGKKTVKCDICGRTYPRLQVAYNDEFFEPKNVSGLKQKTIKCKLAAEAFLEDHYYALYKKSVVRVDLDKDYNETITEEIPVFGGVYHATVSDDEKYMATISLNGTLSVIDLENKKVIAKLLKNRKAVETYEFIFDDNNKLLIFSDNTIFSWDYIKNIKATIWSASENERYICRNVIRGKKAVMFYCLTANEGKSFENRGTVIIASDNNVVSIVSIDGKDNLGKLVYSETLQKYSLCINDEIRIYNETFQEIEKYPYPYFVKYSDGGGCFPITKFGKSSSNPGKVVMSPDGKWILLDYFNEAVLLNQNTKEPVHYLYSYTGSPYNRMGFTNENRLWYTHGNSTYFLDIDDLSH